MIYIDKTPNPSGAYPNPKNQPFSDCITLTDEQAAVFFEYNGFVIVTETEDGVTVEPNIEAWEAWKASLPEPEPEEPETENSLEDRVTALETAIAEGLTLYEEDLGNG